MLHREEQVDAGWVGEWRVDDVARFDAEEAAVYAPSLHAMGSRHLTLDVPVVEIARISFDTGTLAQTVPSFATAWRLSAKRMSRTNVHDQRAMDQR